MDPMDRSIIYNDKNETAECDTWAADLIIKLRTKNAALRAALEQIDTKVTGALNNAFPDDAPDILAHVGGIARAALAAHKNRGKENT